MIRVTRASRLRWLAMVQIKDCCQKCICGDKLRRSIIKIPKNEKDEIQFNKIINKQLDKYNNCKKNL